MVGHIDVGVSSLLAMLLNGLLAARKGIPDSFSNRHLSGRKNTYLLTLFLICFAVSLIKMADLSSLADILEPGPWRASKKRM